MFLERKIETKKLELEIKKQDYKMYKAMAAERRRKKKSLLWIVIEHIWKGASHLVNPVAGQLESSKKQQFLAIVNIQLDALQDRGVPKAIEYKK